MRRHSLAQSKAKYPFEYNVDAPFGREHTLCALGGAAGDAQTDLRAEKVRDRRSASCQRNASIRITPRLRRQMARKQGECPCIAIPLPLLIQYRELKS
jgi:hypothetical protein